MLAVLTETLDSIPVDEDGLPSFEALADGDVTNASDQSCPSTPDGSPRTPEPEEPSLVRLPLSVCFCLLHNPLLPQTMSIPLILSSFHLAYSVFLSLSPAWPSHTPDKEMLQACDQKRVRALQAAPLAGRTPWLCSELSHAAQMKEQIKVDLCSVVNLIVYYFRKPGVMSKQTILNIIKRENVCLYLKKNNNLRVQVIS